MLALPLAGCPPAPADRCEGGCLLCLGLACISLPLGGLCHLDFPLLARLLLPRGCSLAPSFQSVYVPPGMSKLSIWMNFRFVFEKPKCLQSHVQNRSSAVFYFTSFLAVRVLSAKMCKCPSPFFTFKICCRHNTHFALQVQFLFQPYIGEQFIPA